MADETPKIHIDSDWKKQAQEEKKRLAEEVEQKARQAPAGGEQAVGPEGIPEASFSELLSDLGTRIFMFLGQIPQPGTNQRVLSLPLAKHYIDLLAILDKRTRGNLEDEEKKLLDQLLYESRMAYVQMASSGVGQDQGGQEDAGGQGGGPAGPIAGPDILGGQGG